MGNNSQLIIFLIIAAISVIQWTAKQVAEKREIRQINEARRKMRESGVMETPTPTSDLAEQRKEHLKKMREAHAQRLRAQNQEGAVQVQSEQLPQRGQRAPAAARPQQPTPAPRQPSQGIKRRPLRPGRTARGAQPAQAPVQVSPKRRRPQPAMDPNHTVLGALDHKALSSEEAGGVHSALPSQGGAATESGIQGVRRTRINWKRAILYSEILAPPVSMRPPTDG